MRYGHRMPPPSPTVAAWELTLRIKQRRKDLGIEVKTITGELGFTRNYWSAIENGRAVLAEEKLRALADLLEMDAGERDELLELRETSKQRGWWSAYTALFSEPVLRLFGIEYGARSIQTFESLLIPGQLQTADYARALMDADVSVRPMEIDQRIEARLRRQERLNGDDPWQYTALISQAALVQQIGGPSVLRAQLSQLVKIVEEHSGIIEVRVLPFTSTTGLHGASTFYIFDFARPSLPTAIWLDMVVSGDFVEDPERLRGMFTAYEQAMKYSLSAEDSLALIERHAKECE